MRRKDFRAKPRRVKPRRRTAHRGMLLSTARRELAPLAVLGQPPTVGADRCGTFRNSRALSSIARFSISIAGNQGLARATPVSIGRNLGRVYRARRDRRVIMRASMNHETTPAAFSAPRSDHSREADSFNGVVDLALGARHWRWSRRTPRLGAPGARLATPPKRDHAASRRRARAPSTGEIADLLGAKAPTPFNQQRASR